MVGRTIYGKKDILRYILRFLATLTITNYDTYVLRFLATLTINTMKKV